MMSDLLPNSVRSRAPRRALTSFAASFAILAGVLVGGGTAQAQDIEQITDDYLFSKSLSEFGEIRDQRPHPDQLDWSSDGCSNAPDTPLGFDFTPGCHRHDFGYRNYKKQDRFTEDNRKKIDDQFYADLKGICDGNGTCNAAAWTYYQAVRKFGNN